MENATVNIGTSGWSYDSWKGIVYPADSPLRERLEWYVQRFDTVEVNATYYHWPKDSVFEGWERRLPDGFVFTAKAPKALTHNAKLLHPEDWTRHILTSMAKLKSKRGVLLVQLPPSLECDLLRLEHFLSLITPFQRVAVEFRHPSWNDEEVFATLQKHNAAYCIMSGANLPCLLRATADFVYVRLHGPDPKYLYAGSYSDEDMRWWAERIGEWTHQGRSVYAYFNNDGYGNAVRNAETLRAAVAERAVDAQLCTI
jgi:uncharacterized protein YecE (DUF72 family)